MKRQEWILIFFPLIVVWYLDRVTKTWATGLLDYRSYGFISFTLRHNPGAMLGFFSELPAFLRIVTLSTVGAFLVVIYALIQYLLPIKSLILRSGMSVLLGGILGNVTDRILWGHVVDFIILSAGRFSTPVFNLADLLQWFGYGMIIYSIAKEGGILWPENNARKRYWIKPQFQLKYCYLLLAVGFSITFIMMVFSYTYMKVALADLIGPNSSVADKFLTPFAATFGLISLAFSIGLFTVGKIISHKIAGPIFAFEKYVSDLLNARENHTEVRHFKLRTHDEFKELEILAHEIKSKLVPEVQETAAPIEPMESENK